MIFHIIEVLVELGIGLLTFLLFLKIILDCYLLGGEILCGPPCICVISRFIFYDFSMITWVGCAVLTMAYVADSLCFFVHSLHCVVWSMQYVCVYVSVAWYLDLLPNCESMSSLLFWLYPFLILIMGVCKYAHNHMDPVVSIPWHVDLHKIKWVWSTWYFADANSAYTQDFFFIFIATF